MILSVVFYIFIVCTAIQIGYYLIFSKILFLKKNELKNQNIPISVIIFVKNSAKNLPDFLPSIIDQNYSNFEIILIDNESSDETPEIIHSFIEKHSNIRLVSVENNETFWGNKKYALTLGIKAAKHEYLLFIEPTCKPVSEHWIMEMSQQFSEKKSIVLGYVSYEYQKTIVNFIIRFYHLIKAAQYLNFAKLGIPMMADGKNLAYQKKEFYKAKGFIYHIKQELGEDDLFIRDAANNINTAICIDKNSVTENLMPFSFFDWFHFQRKKMFLLKKFKTSHRFLIGLFSVSKFICYLFGIILLLFYSSEIVLPLFVSYFLVQFIVIGLISKKLTEKNLIFFLPFLDISFLLIQISIFIANFVVKPAHWK